MSRAHDQHRGNSVERGYDQRWLKAARVFKRENPWCVGCLAIGVKTKTHTVDHIRPHKGDRVLFWDVTNWQACCEWHHVCIKLSLELQYALGNIKRDALRLDSPYAIELTRARHRPRVAVDGSNVEGT